MSVVIAAMGDVLGLVTTVVSTITGNPILLFFLATGLVGVGVGVFKLLKRGAR